MAADEAAANLRAFLDAWDAKIRPDRIASIEPDPCAIPARHVVLGASNLRAVLDEHEQARPSAVLGATDDGRLRIVCPACDWDAIYTSLDLITATAVVREHVATHVPLCVCGCVPDEPCGCTVHDCECADDCPVCDRQEPDDDAGHGDAVTHRTERT